MDTTRIGGAPVTKAHYARLAASLVASFIASMIGGAVMAVVMVVAYAAVHKMGLLYALRPIGALLYGDAMMTAPTPLMYVGAVAFHFGICAVWGIVFALAASLSARRQIVRRRAAARHRHRPGQSNHRHQPGVAAADVQRLGPRHLDRDGAAAL